MFRGRQDGIIDEAGSIPTPVPTVYSSDILETVTVSSPRAVNYWPWIVGGALLVTFALLQSED